MTIDDVHVHVVHCTHHNIRGRGEQSFLFRPSAPLSNFELAIAGGGSACASQASCKAQAVSRSVPEKKKKKKSSTSPLTQWPVFSTQSFLSLQELQRWCSSHRLQTMFRMKTLEQAIVCVGNFRKERGLIKRCLGLI